MDDLLPEPLPGRFTLVVAPHSATRLLLERAALLALRGPLRVLDGGNCFNVYVVAQALRRRSPQIQQALGRILLSRAFTCYQVLALLEDSVGTVVSDATRPLLFLDLLATFRDENVRMEERRRLLQMVMVYLRRLAGEAPVLVSVTPAGGGDAVLHDELLMLLEDAADPVWRFNPPPPQLLMRLF
jgi:hypothetical protein